MVGEMLVYADRGRKSNDGIYRRFRHAKGNDAKRFHVLPGALFMQDVEPDGRLARTGESRQHDELLFGNRQRDIFQVVQPGAANGDVSRHLTSRVGRVGVETENMTSHIVTLKPWCG